MGHHHAHAEPGAPDARRRLAIVLAITAVLAIAEALGGLWAGSLTLLADAGHMASDCGALGLALFAAWMASRKAPPHRTFGFQRIEILAAMVNAVLLCVVMVSVAREAILRLGTPNPPATGPMFVLGALGLAGNLVGVLLLHGHAHANLNVRGAYLEVAADLVASLGVLAAATTTHFWRWVHADAIVSLALAVFIAPRVWHLLRETTDILMEAAPRDLDVPAVEQAIAAVPGVAEVHDLHVWAITPSNICLSAHVVGVRPEDRDALLARVATMLRDRFGFGHTTLQIEPPPDPAGDGEITGGCGACEPAGRAAGAGPGH